MTTSSPYRSRTALNMLVGAAVILVVGVAATAALGFNGPTQTRTVGDSFTGIRQIAVDIDSGDLDVTVAEGDTTTITGELRWNTRSEPEFTMTRNGSKLTLHARGCDVVLFRHCTTRAAVTVPKDVDVDIHVDSGDVSADGVTGSLRLDIDSGNGRMRDVAGPIDVVVDSGNVTGTGLTAGRTAVDIDSGDVSLDYTTAPAQVVIDSDSSDVTVRVPRQTTPYLVAARTDSGDLTVNVANAASGANRIQIDNDSGNVLVDYLA